MADKQFIKGAVTGVLCASLVLGGGYVGLQKAGRAGSTVLSDVAVTQKIKYLEDIIDQNYLEDALRSIFHEIRRGVVHIRHHPAVIADDRAAVAPGDSRREKARDFTVFAPLETMRHADRIGSDELRPVVAVVQGFEQLAQRFELHKNRVNGIY